MKFYKGVFSKIILIHFVITYNVQIHVGYSSFRGLSSGKPAYRGDFDLWGNSWLLSLPYIPIEIVVVLTLDFSVELCTEQTAHLSLMYCVTVLVLHGRPTQ